ncbi:MAG: YbaK/EbsC family protein [Candidatus Obscuribacterales bacterium]|nr:YbaK/EbsC family protein [Candidatus Obscuribacterales bacterium]
MQKHLPVFDFLDANKFVYKRETFPDTTEKGAANVAHALGFRERQMVKTLIFETDKNECALVMVGGDQNAISGHLKKVLGSRNISMCSPEKVKAVTGYVIGSIPPFHWQPEGFKTFLEESLCAEEVLGVGTGCWGEEILITPNELIKASKAVVVNLTDRERPIFPE